MASSSGAIGAAQAATVAPAGGIHVTGLEAAERNVASAQSQLEKAEAAVATARDTVAQAEELLEAARLAAATDEEGEG